MRPNRQPVRDTDRLVARMKLRTERRSKEEKKATHREEVIKERYVDEAQWFDRDALLASLITETRSNFLKLDQELSEEHALATQRLHSSVFAHANDFLQLFRDVRRASELVESLKLSVQGTKSIISNVSKFTFSKDNVGLESGSGGAGRLHNAASSVLGRGHATSMGVALTSFSRNGSRMRPSLVCDASDGFVPMKPTTQSLNTPSLALWREQIGGDNGAFGSAWGRNAAAASGYSGGGASGSGAAAVAGAARPGSSDADKDVMLFCDVIKGEVTMMIGERQFGDASEFLRTIDSEGTARGCVPLLLDLEAHLVASISEHLLAMPAANLYWESVQLPHIQLLLRFGRLRKGSNMFFQLSTAWLDAELTKLPVRINPKHYCITATDFLISAIEEILGRQKNLFLTIEELKQQQQKQDGESTARAPSSSKAAAVPPSSRAVLWIRQRIEKLAREVVSTHILSYNTGADGGDPSRFRSAVKTVADVIKIVRRMDGSGFAHCDKLLLHMLSPSLIYLQSEFSEKTESRLDSIGRSMIDALIHSVELMYQSEGERYSAAMAADVSRKNNRGCRELLARLTAIPKSSYTVLIQLLFAPASSHLFERSEAQKVPPLPLDRYSFLRYANGCTRMHGLVISAVVLFIAAMSGSSVISSETSVDDATSALRAMQLECASFLMGEALITESLDATLHLLLVSFVRAECRKRRAIVQLASSLSTREANRRLFPKPPSSASGDSQPPTRLLNTPWRSPGWLLDAMLATLADCVSVGCWASFISRGGAVSTLLGDSNLSFRVHYVEGLRRAMPEFVQSAMASTLILGNSMKAAQDIYMREGAMRPQSPTFSPASSISYATAAAKRAMTQAEPHSPRIAMSTLRNATGEPSSLTEMQYEQSISSFAARPSAFDSIEPKGEHPVDKAPIQVADAPPLHTTQLPLEAKVRKGALTPFLIAVLSMRHATTAAPKGQRALGGSAAAGELDMTYRRDGVREDSLRDSLSDSVRMLELAEAVKSNGCSSWHVRDVIPSYPPFPLGAEFDFTDELFLFHWCAQLSLNILSMLQERLLIPSFTCNTAAARLTTATVSPVVPLKSSVSVAGCASPREESVLGQLCAGGGGNYVAAIGLVQFLLVRLVEEVLCGDDAWNTVYQSLRPAAKGVAPASSAEAAWKRDPRARQQQLFFFALVLYIWGPLFSRGLFHDRTELLSDAGNRSYSDSLPPLTHLETLVCLPPGYEPATPDPATAARVAAAAAAAADDAVEHSAAAGPSDRPGRRVFGERRKRPAAPAQATPGSGAGDVTPGGTGVNSGSSAVLDHLMSRIAAFFESLGEERAAEIISSDAMRSRIIRAATTINLSDFARHSSLLDDEDDSSSDEEDGSSDSSGSRAQPATAAKPASTLEKKHVDVTLQDVRNLIRFYVKPLR